MMCHRTVLVQGIPVRPSPMMPTTPHWKLVLLSLVVVLLLLPLATATTLRSSIVAQPTTCPQDCHCIPDAAMRWQISCHWDSVDSVMSGRTSLAQLFSAPNTIVNLAIHCSNAGLSNSFVARMFEGLSNLAQLEIANCRLANAELLPHVFDGLPALRTLKLSSQRHDDGALRIASGAISGLSNLEQLHLTHLNLWHLPAMELCAMPELKLLNLSGNRIESVRDIGLAECEQPSSLLILDLSINQMHSVGLLAKALERLPSVLIFNLAYNRLEQVDFNQLASMQLLQELYLQGNGLQRFQGNLNVSLPALRHLDLSRNQLTLLSMSILNHALLRSLNTSHNYIEVLDTTGSRFPSLTSWDLSHNRLHDLSGMAFTAFNALEQLDLSWNMVQTVGADAFHGLYSLQTLDASNNPLSTIHEASFRHLSKLTTLLLSNNSLTGLATEVFAGTVALQALDLSRNLLLQIPNAVTSLYYLESLDLSDNKVRSIQKFLFDKLPHLTRLSLARNNIATVQRYMLESLPNLEWLNLADNAIAQVETDCFRNTPNLREVLLQDNLLTSIDGVFSNLPKLATLNLTGNLLVHVDLSAMLPVSLLNLHLSGNRVQRVSNYLHGRRSVSLQKLDLSRNLIHNIVDLDLIPESLVEVNFSYNKIQQIPEDIFSRRSKLSVLDIRYNALIELNQTLVQLPEGNDEAAQVQLVRRLFLAGNPLRCSCQVAWLKTYDVRLLGAPNFVDIPDVQQLTCSDVITGAVKPLTLVPSEEFLCQYTSKCSGECKCCEYERCDCNNVCPVGCSCFLDLNFSQNIVQCSRSEVTPFDLDLLPMYATKIYLDGVVLGQLKQHAFKVRRRLKELYLNGSSLTTIAPGAFKDLKELVVLDLSSNELTNLTGEEFDSVPRLASLSLAHNELHSIGVDLFDRIPSLRQLNLHGNKLQLLPELFDTAGADRLTSVTMGRNEWKCDCNDRFALQRWLPAHTEIVVDQQSVFCFENLNITDDSTVLARVPVPHTWDNTVRVNFWTFREGMNTTFCANGVQRDKGAQNKSTIDVDWRGDEAHEDVQRFADWLGHNMAVAMAVGGVLMFLLVAVAAAIAYCGRKACRYSNKYTSHAASDTCYVSNSGSWSTPPNPPCWPPPKVPHGRFCPSSEPLLPTHDAFIMYSKVDAALVEEQLTPALDAQFPYYTVRLLHRRFQTESSGDDIRKAVQHSQRVIIVLTRAFVDLEWCKPQIRDACDLALRKRSKLIIVKADNVALDVNAHLSCYLRKTETLWWNEPQFWAKLRELFPDKILDTEWDLTADSADDYREYARIGDFTRVDSEFV